MLTTEQRLATIEDCLRLAVDAGSKRMRCACPGIVRAWNAVNQTVSVQLAIKEVLKIDGSEQETEIPLLVDVPVVMPRAGGYSLLFVPQAGDECLVVFSDMCIDAWYQSGGVQSQAERRRHDLSDGFAIMGCWSQVKKPTFPTSGIRLQNDAGTAYVSIDSDGVHFAGADIGVEDIDSNANGVAVGMESTATASAKKFEVAQDHDALFYGDAQVDGTLAVGGDATISGDLSVTGDLDMERHWIDFTDNLNGITCTDSVNEPVMVCKIAGVTYIQGAVHLNAQLNSYTTKAAVMTLPEGYRPIAKVRLPIWMSVDMLELIINTDGTVDIHNFWSTAVATSRTISLACCFVGGT